MMHESGYASHDEYILRAETKGEEEYARCISAAVRKSNKKLQICYVYFSAIFFHNRLQI